MAFPWKVIWAACEVGNVPFEIGPYQCGKSQGALGIGHYWWNLTDSEIHTLFLENNDPITLGTGYPTPDLENSLTFTQRIERKLLNVATNPNGLLIVDEVSAATRDQMRGLSPLVLNKEIAGMPVECKIILCGNRPRDGSNEIDPQLASRVQWVAVSRDRALYQRAKREGWKKTMGKSPVMPGDWEKNILTWEKQVDAYIDIHPDAVPDEDAPFDPDFPARPGLRTWDMGVRYLAGCEAAGLSKKETQLGLEGCVGRAHGNGFMMQLRFDGINVRELVSDTSKLKEYKDSTPDKIDMIFDAVNAYMIDKSITGEDCGAFYAAAIKYDFDLDMILRHGKEISEKLPKPVREAIFAEIQNRRAQEKN